MKHRTPRPGLSSDSYLHGEKNDCTVVSLAEVTGSTYFHALNVMASVGRPARKAPQWSDLKAVPGMDLMFFHSERDKPTLLEFCRSHPKGRYWIGVRGHMLAVIDGVIVDQWAQPRRRVLVAFKAVA